MVPGLTDAALAVVGKAVFAEAAKQLTQTLVSRERLRAAIGRDPRQLAFQVALARAYASFARSYPEWTASLFDQTFLGRAAAPLLARCIVRAEPPDARELAELWSAQAGVQAATRDSWVADATPVAADFLRWFRAELRAREEFRDLFDSLALDETAASTREAAAALMRLTAEVADVLSVATQYQAAVEEATRTRAERRTELARAPALGQAAFFTGVYGSLQEFYVPPEEVFDRVHIESFVGRNWLEDDIDQFLEDPRQDRGVWLLVGEAGVGKTSFLAHVVRERRYVHLFSEQVAGEANLARALQSLTVQLISRFRIDPYASRDTLPQFLSTAPDFFGRILRSASDRLGAGEKLVLVIDALDEAGAVAGGNVLGLPRHLPRGVYLIVSQRPRPLALNIDAPLRRVDLTASDPLNQDDVDRYLRRLAARPPIDAVLRDAQLRAETFVQSLARKSEGNWMYLHYVLEEIRRGQRRPLDLSELPAGLAGYYAEYWAGWRARPGWDEVRGPLLASLGACQEAVNVPTLKRWAGVQEDDFALGRVLRDEWRPFVTEVKGGEPRYRLYHASLRDFLSSPAASSRHTPGVEMLVEELRQRVREAHSRIAGDGLTRCAGDWAALARDPYYARFLSTHLRLAGDATGLFALVDKREWAATLTEVDPGGTLILNDIGQARVLAESIDRECVATGDPAPLLLREVRCALASASVRSCVRRLPPELLVALIREGLWSPAQVLEAANQHNDARSRIRTIVSLLPFLPADAAAEGLRQALAQVPLVGDEFGDRRVRDEFGDDIPWRHDWEWRDQGVALAQLVQLLPDSLLPVAFDVARNLSDEGHRSLGIAALAPRLAAELVAEALAVVREMKFDWKRQECIAALAPYLSDRHLDDVVALVSTFEPEFARAQALGALAPHLPARLRERAARVADALTDAMSRAWALLSLTACSPPRSKMRARLDEAIALLPSIDAAPNRSWVSELIDQVAPRLSPAKRRKTLEIVLRISDAKVRLGAVRALLPHIPRRALPPDLLSDAVGWTRLVRNELSGDDEWTQAWELGELAPFLTERELADGVNLALRIQKSTAWTHAVEKLAPHLPSSSFETLLDRVSAAEDGHTRWELVGAMARHATSQQAAQLLDTVSAPTPADLYFGGIHHFESLADRLPRSALGRALELAIEAKSLPQNLASRLPEHLLDAAVEALPRIEYPHRQADWISVLAPNLPGDLLRKAWRRAQEIPHAAARATALAALAVVPSFPSREAALDEALACASDHETPASRALAIVQLAPHLEPADRRRALLGAVQTARVIGDERHLLQLQVAVASGLPESRRSRMADEIRGVADLKWRAVLLARLAQTLPVEARTAAWDDAYVAAAAIPDAEERAAALSDLAAYIPAAMLRRVLLEAVAAGVEERIGGLSRPPHILRTVARFLPTELHEEALELARGFQDRAERAAALLALLPCLSGELAHTAALDLVEVKGPPWIRKSILTSLIGQPELGSPADVLKEIHAIEKPEERTRLLIDIAPKLPTELRDLTLREALSGAMDAKSSSGLDSRQHFLVDLTPQLSTSLAREAVSRIMQLRYIDDIAPALAGVASGASAEVLSDIRQIAVNIRWPRYRDEVLERLATREAQLGQVEEAVATARCIEHHARRAHAMFSVAVSTPQEVGAPVVSEALQCILTLPDKTPLDLGPNNSGSWLENRDWKAHALVRLARLVPAHLLQGAIKTLIEVSDGKPSFDDELVHRLVEVGRSELLHGAWCDTLGAASLRDRRDLVRVLFDVVSIADALAGSPVVVSLVDAIDDVRSRWP